MEVEDKKPGDPKSKATGPAKYKAMVKKPAVQSLAADTTQAPSPDNPIMVQKSDGSIGQWGNDPGKPSKNPLPPVKKQILLSDKAKGKDNTYSPSRNYSNGPDVKPQYKSEFRY